MANDGGEWDGKERRAVSDFERTMIAFTARQDQRNMDQDIQAAAREEAATKRDEDVEIRLTSLEHSRTILKTIYIGLPALAGAVLFVLEIAEFLKSLKAGHP